MSYWREASSIILLTRSPNINSSFKVLCLKRSNLNSFLPNVTVFPGGTTEKSDSSLEWINIIPAHNKLELNLNIVGYNDEPVLKLIQDNEKNSISKDFSLRIAAIRETFEESGILLCRKRSNSNINTSFKCSHLEIEQISSWRKLVQNDASKFIDLCYQNNCYPNISALFFWSNWLSPPVVKSKFDTKFFIAIVNSPTFVTPDGIETSYASWNTPDEILSKFELGEEILVTPQFYELLRLKRFISIEALIKFIPKRIGQGCEQIIPKIIVVKDGILTLLPGDGKYKNLEDALQIYYDADKNLKDFDTTVMHRIHVTDRYLPIKLIINNYTSKHGHIVPFTKIYRSNL
ncbi:acyl-coenzyme A diphosphatase NUDT19-like [Daktulosphaira vitifoliae]|uniref:acyl-coenzyme A diphosphatase NUDT19-like n=1 Tax=Daktulosphaira vitifoliae TaxID=58002 RepID=UPI0021AA7D0B|nr:acyl-coenzyme A diphosphatase NUDT19-like [Daktulosphaira vitifoliae]